MPSTSYQRAWVGITAALSALQTYQFIEMDVIALHHALVRSIYPRRARLLSDSIGYLCRDALDQVVERTLALVGFLKAQGATATHNMDNLLLRESMDVIGEQAF